MLPVWVFVSALKRGHWWEATVKNNLVLYVLFLPQWRETTFDGDFASGAATWLHPRTSKWMIWHKISFIFSRFGTTFNSWSMPNDSSPDLITQQLHCIREHDLLACSSDVYIFHKTGKTRPQVDLLYIQCCIPRTYYKYPALEIAIFSYQEFKCHCVNKSQMRKVEWWDSNPELKYSNRVH
jgi:hypothetical protein